MGISWHAITPKLIMVSARCQCHLVPPTPIAVRHLSTGITCIQRLAAHLHTYGYTFISQGTLYFRDDRVHVGNLFIIRGKQQFRTRGQVRVIISQPKPFLSHYITHNIAIRARCASKSVEKLASTSPQIIQAPLEQHNSVVLTYVISKGYLKQTFWAKAKKYMKAKYMKTDVLQSN